MKTTLRLCLLLPAFSPFCLAQPAQLNQTPPLPTHNGTYYYERYDADNSRHVYFSSTGTYYYVDNLGTVIVGGPASLDTLASPYQVTISGTLVTFQFYNNNPVNYTVTASGTDFSVRSGTWRASDVTFTHSANSGGSGIWVEGVSGTFSATAAVTGSIVTSADGSARVIYEPTVTFIGANVSSIVDVSNNVEQQALSIRNGATVYLTGGTLSKSLPSGSGSETILLVSNQEGQGSSSYFRGENLTITSYGNISTFTLGQGNNVVELYNSTITSTITAAAATPVINLANGTTDLGGNHFYGENLLIDVTGTTTNHAIYMGPTSENSVTLVSSTLLINIGGKTQTSESIYMHSTDAVSGNTFRGEDLYIYNAAGRLFVFGTAAVAKGEHTISLKDSNIVDDGRGATFDWNNSTSTTGDRFVSQVILENTNVLTTSTYSPMFQQVGNIGHLTVTGGTLTTTDVGSPIMRLIAVNDRFDSTRHIAIFTGAVVDARQSSVFDIEVGANDANYSQVGGNAKNLGTMVESSYDIVIQSSTVSGGLAAMRIATGGITTSSYLQFTNVYVYDSMLSGGIQMVAGNDAQRFTSGAALTFTASNATLEGGIFITGSNLAMRSNQAIFYVYDSIWAGDIALVNRGNLTLQFKNTPIEGDLTLTGSTRAILRLSDSPILGGITIAGTAEVTGEILGQGHVGPITANGGIIDLTLDNTPVGGITADGTGIIALTIGEDVVLDDGIHVSGNSAVAITLRDATQFTGDITIRDRATFALGTTHKDSVKLSGNIALAGIWHIPSKVTLSGTLAFTSRLGTISIDGASPDILTLSNGLTGDGRLDIISIDGGYLSTGEFRIIHDPTGTFTSATSAPLILAHPVEIGFAAYSLENRADGAYLVAGLDSGSFGAAVFNSYALAAEDWFANLDPVNNHLGQVRQIVAGNLPRAQGDAGSLWIQARSDTTRVDRSAQFLDFTSRTIGLTAGADVRWDQDTGAIVTGIYVDTTRVNRDFIDSADGRTTSVGGGAYVHYQHRTGVFATAVGRFNVNENTLNTYNPNNAMSASYHTQAGGIAIEVGWLKALRDGWWIEPAAQTALVTLPGVSYTTESNSPENIIPIAIASARATQFRGRVAAGKTVDENWHVRGHIAFASVSASGGAFTVPGLSGADFILVGNRFEASLGLTRLIGSSSRVTLDVTYITASEYKRPVAVFAGWCKTW